MQHELLARVLETGLLKNLTSIIGIYPMGESSKRELNNRQFSIVSMSIPGAQTSWAEASFEEREAIHQKYRDYTHGMLWFLKTNPRVPEPIRDVTGRGANRHQQIGTLASLGCNGAIGNIEPRPHFPDPSLVDDVARV